MRTGWWSYEFCFRQGLRQLHLSDKPVPLKPEDSKANTANVRTYTVSSAVGSAF